MLIYCEYGYQIPSKINDLQSINSENKKFKRSIRFRLYSSSAPISLQYNNIHNGVLTFSNGFFHFTQ